MNGALLALGCIGAAQLMAQTALLRLLLFFTGGNELVIGWALAVWLVGGALGALLVRGWQRGFWPVVSLFGLALILTAPAIPAFFPAEPGAFVVEHPLRLLLNCCALFPVAFLGGMLFPLGMRLASGHLPRRYAVDALGAVAGGLFTLWLLSGSVAGFELTGLVVAGSAALLLSAPFFVRWPRLMLAFAPGLLLIVLPTVMFFNNPWRSDIGTRETAQGFFARQERHGQISLYGNRQLLGTWPVSDADRELGFLPAAFVSQPRQGLQVGGLLSPLPDIVRFWLPLSNAIADHNHEASGLLGGSQRPFSPRTSVLTDDPRAVLGAMPACDLITIAGGAPESIAGNRLFTTEFFTLARQRLTPDGVLAFALPVSENYLNPLQAQLVGAEVSSLRDAGFTVGLYPMSRLLVVATPAAALPATDTVLARLAAQGIDDPELASNFTFAAHPLRQDMLRQALAAATAIPNTDARPLSSLLTLAAWLALFADDSNLTLPAGSAAAAGGLALALVIIAGSAIFALRRRAPARAATAALIATGAAAMTTHLLLMVVYQTRCGTLFYELGLLNAGFMLGGSLAAFRRVTPRLLPLLAAVSAALAPLLLLTAPAPGLFTAFALIVLNGWTCGGLFLAFAARLPDGSSRGYAADLAGAAPAALLTLPLFVPLLSIPLTALLAAGLALVTLPVILDACPQNK